MHMRVISVALGFMVFSALGCGGESTSNPPPAVPAPEATTEATNSAPAETPPASAATNSPNPAVATSSAPTGENAAKDKPAPTETKVAKDKPAEKPAAGDIADANITIGQLEADGLVTKNIECKSEGGGGGLGLLGAVLVTAWMAPQKKALDACVAGKEAETRVIWRASGGKVTEIEAKGDAKVKSCVEKALRPGKPVFEGHCAATVVHGKK